jgi:hypothetical protein
MCACHFAMTAMGDLSVSKSRAKGTAWETALCRYLDEALEPFTVERRAGRGANDTGDVAGLKGICIEAKAHKAMELGKWMSEAEVEADKDGGSLPIVAHKRKGKGDAGESYATMPLWAFVELLKAWL